MNREEIKVELKDLEEAGEKLYKSLSSKENKEFFFFLRNYEQWYTKALSAIKQLTPDRSNDFATLYKYEKRKEITAASYTISDAMQGVSRTFQSELLFCPRTASLKLHQQINMVRACYERLDSKLFDIRTMLQSELFDTELEAARHLLKNNHLRAAGVICGVVIEAHLGEVAKNHNISIGTKNPTISNFNDKLKDVAYDIVQYRFIQHLADIRNLCAHKKEREPKKDEVQDLIDGTSKIIKTVF